MSEDDRSSMFRQRRERQIERRRSAADAAIARLTEEGVFFTEHIPGLHLIVMDVWHFWPTTGKFMERRGRPGQPKRVGRGVLNLLRNIEEDASGKSAV